MDVKDYLRLPYNYIIQEIHDESGSYFHARVLEFEGCQSTGNTHQEAYVGLQEAMEGWIEAKLDGAYPIPKPIDADSCSGRFVLRIPKSLHARLTMCAQREGVSLNQYVLYKLSDQLVAIR
ncbi:MAG: type II toxin-antitoxin system HicB family antitoxin [Coriobacteriales bacterium]|jgi:predicted HicB family RNase H-like nuclease|nr:type II toxin-antitoxin system HicB family antitoxin [Coriobacteriales bacterium]